MTNIEPRLLDCGFCYEERGEEVHPHPECPRGGTLQQRDANGWVPAEPLPLASGLDIEVYGTGPWVWIAHRGSNLVGQGRARTRLGLWAATTRARLRHGYRR